MLTKVLRIGGKSPVAIFMLIIVSGWAALAGAVTRGDDDSERWYSAADVKYGANIYITHCLGCHGARGEGQQGWEERDDTGYYPAPPLDGTGHSALHPIQQMLRTLDTGGGPMGGTMPSFSDVLTDEEKRSVIAWMQSLWTDEIYATWWSEHGDSR